MDSYRTYRHSTDTARVRIERLLVRGVRIAMNIVQFIPATVYGRYVKMAKAYVRYGEFIRKAWPIRHGYVMICNDVGVLS